MYIVFRSLFLLKIAPLSGAFATTIITELLLICLFADIFLVSFLVLQMVDSSIFIILYCKAKLIMNGNIPTQIIVITFLAFETDRVIHQ